MDQMMNMEDGFGISSMSDLAELRKALDFGYGAGNVDGGINSLRMESLDTTLRLMTYSQPLIKLWNQIPKTEAYSTIEEYNMLLSYGQDGGAFTQSGELPQEEDSVYDRAAQKVKFLGTTRSVTHPASLIRTAPADLIAQETQNGALWLMGKINHALYYGDSDAVPVEWNGLIKQIEDGAGTVIDLEGGPLTKEAVEEAAYIVGENFGQSTRLYTNNKVFADFSNTYLSQMRFNAPNTSPGLIGTPITGIQTTSGPVMFEGDTFVKEGVAAGNSATSLKAPATPQITIGSPTTGNAGSKFKPADAGEYVYRISAVNQYGESVPSPLSSAVTVASTGRIPITIKDQGGVVPATAYRIYRSTKGDTTPYSLHKVIPRNKVSGLFTDTTLYYDLNTYRPRTFVGLMLDMTPQSLVFKQLSPMIKMNLAIISPAIRWMQLLYGTPIVFAPKRNVVFRNIGKTY